MTEAKGSPLRGGQFLLAWTVKMGTLDEKDLEHALRQAIGGLSWSERGSLLQDIDAALDLLQTFQDIIGLIHRELPKPVLDKNGHLKLVKEEREIGPFGPLLPPIPSKDTMLPLKQPEDE